MRNMVVMKCYSIIKGYAEGEALVSKEPISFWGDFDPKSGCIISKTNPLYNRCVKGKILIFPYGRGSSTSSAIFLEAARLNNTPVAIVNIKTEPILAIGAILAEKLYNVTIPIVYTKDSDPTKVFKTGDYIKVDGINGIIQKV